MSIRRYMTNKQAAEYLGIKEDALRKLAQRREVPHGRRGNRLVYDKVILDEWMKVCHKKLGVTLQEALQRLFRKRC